MLKNLNNLNENWEYNEWPDVDLDGNIISNQKTVKPLALQEKLCGKKSKKAVKEEVCPDCGKKVCECDKLNEAAEESDNATADADISKKSYTADKIKDILQRAYDYSDHTGTSANVQITTLGSQSKLAQACTVFANSKGLDAYRCDIGDLSNLEKFLYKDDPFIIIILSQFDQLASAGKGGLYQLLTRGKDILPQLQFVVLITTPANDKHSSLGAADWLARFPFISGNLTEAVDNDAEESDTDLFDEVQKVLDPIFCPEDAEDDDCVPVEEVADILLQYIGDEGAEYLKSKLCPECEDEDKAELEEPEEELTECGDGSCTNCDEEQLNEKRGGGNAASKIKSIVNSWLKEDVDSYSEDDFIDDSFIDDEPHHGIGGGNAEAKIKATIASWAR